MKIILATDSAPNYGLAYFYYLALKKNSIVKEVYYLHAENKKVSQTNLNRVLNRFNAVFFPHLSKIG